MFSTSDVRMDREKGIAVTATGETVGREGVEEAEPVEGGADKGVHGVW